SVSQSQFQQEARAEEMCRPEAARSASRLQPEIVFADHDTRTLLDALRRRTIIPPPTERSHGPSGALGPVHSSRGSSFKLVRGNCGELKFQNSSLPFGNC